jgi:hypothetical protein
MMDEIEEALKAAWIFITDDDQPYRDDEAAVVEKLERAIEVRKLEKGLSG